MKLRRLPITKLTTNLTLAINLKEHSCFGEIMRLARLILALRNIWGIRHDDYALQRPGISALADSDEEEKR